MVCTDFKMVTTTVVVLTSDNIVEHLNRSNQTFILQHSFLTFYQACFPQTGLVCLGV